MERNPFNKEDFQRMNRAVRPDGWLEERTKAAMRRETAAPRRRGKIAARCAVAATAAACAAGLALAPGRPAAEMPASGGVPSSVPVSDQEYQGFQLRLHLDGGAGGKTPNLMESEQILEGTAFRWGKMQCTRSKEVWTNPETGEKSYGISRVSFAPFLSLEGDNIASVQATVVNGYVSYRTESFDKYMREEYASGGMNELFSFPVPFGSWDEFRDEFSAYWESPACDQWRKKEKELYPVLRAGESVCYRFNAAAKDSATVTAAIRWMSPFAPQTIDYARDGKILYMNWHPNGEIDDALSAYPPIPYEEIPSGSITIHVTFTDGRTQTQTIELSLDKDGYVMAKLKHGG